MQKLPKLLKMTALLAVSGSILGGCQAANQPFQGSKTNHFNPYNQNAARHQTPFKAFKAPKRKNVQPFYNQYGQLVYPQRAVYQQGRVIMPMLSPIMAAGRTVTDVQAALRDGLASQLRDPRVAVTPRAYSPQQVFVGGQVQQPGTYT